MKERDKKSNKLHRRRLRIDDETKIYKAEELEQQEQEKRTFVIAKKVITVLVFCIIIFAVFFAVKAHSWKKIVTEMAQQKNSIILDTNNETIATIGTEKKKVHKEYSVIPQDLKEAYVAIEDERFYKHGGIDLKRTVGAIGSYIIHLGKSSYGGSTITQQLVKNITGDSKSSISRKVAEWFRACQVETFLSKDEVLGFYLNIIYTGPNIYGVGAGANYYFNEKVENLTLAECAFLAGINNSPNSYNPFEGDNKERISKRTKIVLNKMKELGYITEEEFDSAVKEVENGLSFNKGSINSGTGVYSYHSDATLNECINDIKKKYHISETFATNYIEMAGLKIYSTVDSKIQKEAENECKKSKYSITSSNEKSQAAIVILEPSTGRVLGCVGGLGEKTNARSLNRATQSVRQTGSSIKPLSVLVPAISKNIINATTICDDTQRDFGNGYAPRDFGKSLGKVTVRRALESSQNIPFVEIMEKVTPKRSIRYLKRMGITTLTKNDEALGLALGGLEKGITPLQMAAAYNTISNDGKYIEPTFYTKITDSSNNTLLKSKQKKRRVFSKSVAFVIKELLTQPVEGTYGTAVYCKINGVDVAAKTGTTDEDYDKWLCGFTPYYTAACWFGYDQNKTIEFNNRNPAGLIWANVMSRIHTGKVSARFEMPTGFLDNVVSYKVCSDSGKLARKNCEHTYTEYYLTNNIPGYCSIHGGSEQSNSSKKVDDTKKVLNEIIQGITNEIDAIDPQELEKSTMNMVDDVVENTITTKNEILDNATNKIVPDKSNPTITNENKTKENATDIDSRPSQNNTTSTNNTKSETTSNVVKNDIEEVSNENIE